MAAVSALNIIIFEFVSRMEDEWCEPWDWWCRRQVGIVGAMGVTLGRGIVPDVHIPWTPAQLSHDVELETACEAVVG